MPTRLSSMPFRASARLNLFQSKRPSPVPFAQSPPRVRSWWAPRNGVSEMTHHLSAMTRSLRSSISSRCGYLSSFSFWVLTASIAQLEVLDVYLPLLTDASTRVSMCVAQLLGAALRAPSYRTAVAEWVPPSERTREVPRGRRRWERPETVASAQSSGGGWVARHLTTLLRGRDVKVQETALNALAALAKDNHDVAVHLAKAPVGRSSSGTWGFWPSIRSILILRVMSESPPALTLALGLCKSRSTDVQLAASLW